MQAALFLFFPVISIISAPKISLSDEGSTGNVAKSQENRSEQWYLIEIFHKSKSFQSKVLASFDTKSKKYKEVFDNIEDGIDLFSCKAGGGTFIQNLANEFPGCQICGSTINVRSVLTKSDEKNLVYYDGTFINYLIRMFLGSKYLVGSTTVCIKR